MFSDYAPGCFEQAEQDFAEESDRRIVIEHYMDRLPATYQTVLHLRFWQQKTEEEIARHLGISQPAVSKQVTRALALLKEMCDEEEL